MSDGVTDSVDHVVDVLVRERRAERERQRPVGDPRGIREVFRCNSERPLIPTMEMKRSVMDACSDAEVVEAALNVLARHARAFAIDHDRVEMPCVTGVPLTGRG